jgi:hypothetical protein
MRKYPKAWRRHVDRLVELQNVKNETREEEIKSETAAKALADKAAKHKLAAKRRVRRSIVASLYKGIYNEFKDAANAQLDYELPTWNLHPLGPVPTLRDTRGYYQTSGARKTKAQIKARRRRKKARDRRKAAADAAAAAAADAAAAVAITEAERLEGERLAREQNTLRVETRIWREKVSTIAQSSLSLKTRLLEMQAEEIQKEVKNVTKIGQIANLNNEAAEVAAELVQLAQKKAMLSDEACGRRAVAEFKSRGYEDPRNWPRLSQKKHKFLVENGDIFPTYDRSGAHFDDESDGEMPREVAVVAEAPETRRSVVLEVEVTPVLEVAPEEVPETADEIYIVEPQEALEQAVEPVAELSTDIHVVEEAEVFTETKNEQSVAAFADGYAGTGADAFDDELDDMDLAGLDSLFDDIGLANVEGDDYSESSLDQLDRLIEEQNMGR